jgi:proline iminopeptidase
VADLERIRIVLGIDAWLVVGRSWGAYLALRYGAKFPHRCRGFLLFGTFLPDREAVDRLYRAPRHADDVARRDYLAGAGADCDPLAAYQRRVSGLDRADALAAARSFAVYHNARARGDSARVAAHNAAYSDDEVLAFAAIQLHYARHGFFAGDIEVEMLIDRLRDLPCRLVHGALDQVTPVENSLRIARRWTGATLRVVDGAPHSAFATANFEALKEEATLLAGRLTA